MTSSPLDYMHLQTWHDIIAIKQHTRSNNVGRGMKPPPLDYTHDRTMLGVACHHRLWTTHMVGRNHTWHTIIAFGQHTQSNDVGRGMPSSPLGSTNGRTTSGVAWHDLPWTARTVEQRRAWHDITTLGLNTRLDDVRRGMTSPPLDSTYSRTTSGVA